MKRFFTFIVISTLLSSCVVYSELNKELIGNITTYNANGDILKSWKNVVIQSEVNYIDGTQYEKNVFKTFGVNFYDNASGNFVIIGNSVPYIIEYKDNKTQKNITPNENKTSQTQINTNSVAELKDKLTYIKKTMKNFDINSEEYNKLLNEKEKLTIKLDSLYNIYK